MKQIGLTPQRCYRLASHLYRYAAWCAFANGHNFLPKRLGLSEQKPWFIQTWMNLAAHVHAARRNLIKMP